MSKNKNQLLSISEVAKMFGLINKKDSKPMTHTLRFWETKFKQLKPTTFVGGRRYYSHKNIEVVKMVIFLLKDQRLTINGAIKVMNDKSKKLDDIKTLSIRDKYYKKQIKWLKNHTSKLDWYLKQILIALFFIIRENRLKVKRLRIN